MSGYIIIIHFDPEKFASSSSGCTFCSQSSSQQVDKAQYTKQFKVTDLMLPSKSSTRKLPGVQRGSYRQYGFVCANHAWPATLMDPICAAIPHLQSP